MIQLTGRDHHGITPLIRPMGNTLKIEDTTELHKPGAEITATNHHVTRQKFLPLQYNPVGQRTWRYTPCRDRGVGGGTYITKPTGKTNPPIILTSPGFAELIPAEPPEMISESKPPKESIAPARNCSSRSSK